MYYTVRHNITTDGNIIKTDGNRFVEATIRLTNITIDGVYYIEVTAVNILGDQDHQEQHVSHYSCMLIQIRYSFYSRVHITYTLTSNFILQMSL